MIIRQHAKENVLFSEFVDYTKEGTTFYEKVEVASRRHGFIILFRSTSSRFISYFSVITRISPKNGLEFFQTTLLPMYFFGVRS